MSDKLSELKVANKYTFQGVLLRFANTNNIKNTTYWMPFIFFSFFFTADLPTTISYCAIWIQHAFKPIPSSWARYTFCCSSPGWVNSLTCISIWVTQYGHSVSISLSGLWFTLRQHVPFFGFSLCLVKIALQGDTVSYRFQQNCSFDHLIRV